MKPYVPNRKRVIHISSEFPKPKVCHKHPASVVYDEPTCPACRLIREMLTGRKQKR